MGRRVTFVARCPSLNYQKGMNMRRFHYLLAVPLFVWVAAGFAPVECMLGVNFVTSAHAQSQPPTAQQALPGAREVPARAIPVHGHRQPADAGGYCPAFRSQLQSRAANHCRWKARVEKVALATEAGLPKLREALGVTVQPSTMGGVKVFIVTPKINRAAEPRPRADAFARRRQSVWPRRIRDT